jgi:hypothetical protein
MNEYVTTMKKIQLDFSDFYTYTRIFLDTLTECIRLSFRSVGNKKYSLIRKSVKFFWLEKMKTYKNEIDYHFFEGLEKEVSWIRNFKDSRDKLSHHFAHFVLSLTRKGELGYDIIDKTREYWGTDTVKDILIELQNTVDNLSNLMEYLHRNLPRAT